jgi:hypothetical protein
LRISVGLGGDLNILPSLGGGGDPKYGPLGDVGLCFRLVSGVLAFGYGFGYEFGLGFG